MWTGLPLAGPTTTALERDEAAEHSQAHEVRLLASDTEHAGEVPDRRDARADALTEGLSTGDPPKVVVSTRAQRLGNDLELAGVASKLDNWFERLRVESKLLAVDSRRA